MDESNQELVSQLTEGNKSGPNPNLTSKIIIQYLDAHPAREPANALTINSRGNTEGNVTLTTSEGLVLNSLLPPAE